ncbi:MAG: type II toxin-antitoxin system Phd/YefM family antitoxin [Prosthecobacter sp.]|nr:type II toxin-antitoxin system Phd/YefM family antitoxin [Prosthecobacter sp.]
MELDALIMRHANAMQIHLEDIHALTEFQRNAKAHLSRVNKTGRAKVLTVNGKAEAVLMGRRSYEQMVEAMEELETLKSIRRGLDEMEAGKTIDAAIVHQRLRKL